MSLISAGSISLDSAFKEKWRRVNFGQFPGQAQKFFFFTIFYKICPSGDYLRLPSFLSRTSYENCIT